MTTQIIAMLDRYDGGVSAGTVQTETRSFNANDPISAILDWVNDKTWRFDPSAPIRNLRIQIDEAPQGQKTVTCPTR